MVVLPAALLSLLLQTGAPLPGTNLGVDAISWQRSTSTGAPRAREAASYVWTGRELIVWGGTVDRDRSNAGSRYDPVADRWQPLSRREAPKARAWHTAVWTGREMIVWGGDGPEDEYDTGARYDPKVDRWRPMTLTDAPAGRGSHMAVWTGREMIVWAGVTDERSFSSGGRYDPVADSWTRIRCPIEQLLPRSTTAVWTERAMLVWGGINGSHVLGHGVRYDPDKDEWKSIAVKDAPSARAGHVAQWTGEEFLVWGGRRLYRGGPMRVDGARYSPTTDRWRPLPSAPVRIAGDEAVSAWTGAEWLIIGGRTSDDRAPSGQGLRFRLSDDTWGAFSVPNRIRLEFAAWTGTHLLLCGTREGSEELVVWRAAMASARPAPKNER